MDIHALVKIAQESYNSGDYENAIKYARQILVRDSTNTEALKILSYIYYHRDEEEDAIEYCSKWVEHDIENSKIPLALLNEIYEKKVARAVNEKVEIEREKAHVEEAAKFRQKLEQMIQQYTHTLANTLFPNIIYEVANKLKNHDELKKDALFLLRAYQAEMFIAKQGELLEIKHTGDANKFRSYIRRSCLSAKTAQEVTTVEQILDAVAARVIARFLNQGKLEHIRNDLSQKHGVSVDTWRASFDEEVLFTNQKTAIQWANDHLAHIAYTLSPSWRQLRFKTGEESYAEALLWGHFGELLFNALKYTDHTRDTWVTMIFDENEQYLTALWENPYTPEKPPSGWRSKGLESIRNDLEMLNQEEKQPRQLDIHPGEHNFKITLYFAKSVFFYQSKIKRRKS